MKSYLLAFETALAYPRLSVYDRREQGNFFNEIPRLAQKLFFSRRNSRVKLFLVKFFLSFGPRMVIFLTFN
jgi:hypothetical protein